MEGHRSTAGSVHGGVPEGEHVPQGVVKVLMLMRPLLLRGPRRGLRRLRLACGWDVPRPDFFAPRAPSRLWVICPHFLGLGGPR
jgi:hypothetical protein